MKKGVFFPARANKLYDLYRRYNSLEEIDEKTRTQIQEKYFKRSFDEVYAETKAYYLKNSPQEIEKMCENIRMGWTEIEYRKRSAPRSLPIYNASTGNWSYLSHDEYSSLGASCKN